MATVATTAPDCHVGVCPNATSSSAPTTLSPPERDVPHPVGLPRRADHGTCTKRFHHPEVGELVLAYEELALTAEPGLVMIV